MNGANVCSVFPVGVFLKQNVHVSFVFFFFLVDVTLASWYFVILCLRCIVAVLTKVFPLAFKKKRM